MWRLRRYREGTDLTLVAFGAMVHEAIAAADASGRRVDVWNPFVLAPLDLGPVSARWRKPAGSWSFRSVVRRRDWATASSRWRRVRLLRRR